MLERVAAGVFDSLVEPQWTAEFLADPRHHIAVAIAGDEVVGMASAVHYIHPDKPPEFWVNEVGVAFSHERQGIGRQLLRTLLIHGRALGCTEAWLVTLPDNLPARRFYAALGGVEAPMVYVAFDLERV